jgi:exodeoxyribonuclease VIII
MNSERPDRVNWSTLKHITVSPKHYLHALATPRADTPALLLGRAAHCALYEPEAFARRYVTMPNFHRGMNDDTARAKGYDGGKQAALEWDAQLRDGVESIDGDLRFTALAIAEAVRRDSVAGPLLAGGHAEHNIQWTDAETGILCRGRVDHVRGCLSDLKTTRSLQRCERDAARFQYHAQLAWYSDGLRASGIATSGAPRLVFVENQAPFDVLVLTFDEEDIEAGRRVYRAALDTLAECRRAAAWPGISRGVARRIQLPAWVLGDDDDVELTLGGKAI